MNQREAGHRSAGETAAEELIAELAAALREILRQCDVLGDRETAWEIAVDDARGVFARAAQYLKGAMK